MMPSTASFRASASLSDGRAGTSTSTETLRRAVSTAEGAHVSFVVRAGEGEGAHVSFVGTALGLSDGTDMGTAEGSDEGTVVGRGLGIFVVRAGEGEGAHVSFVVRAGEGSGVGSRVGSSDGTQAKLRLASTASDVGPVGSMAVTKSTMRPRQVVSPRQKIEPVRSMSCATESKSMPVSQAQ